VVDIMVRTGTGATGTTGTIGTTETTTKPKGSECLYCETADATAR
jgi:hypothetical protein